MSQETLLDSFQGRIVVLRSPEEAVALLRELREVGDGMQRPLDPTALARELAEKIVNDDLPLEHTWQDNHSCGLGRYGCCGGGKDIDREALKSAILTAFATLEAAIREDERKKHQPSIADHYGHGWLAGQSSISTCRRCGGFLNHGHQCDATEPTT